MNIYWKNEFRTEGWMNDQLQNLSERLKYIRDNKIYAFEYILGISEESSFASSGRITSEQPQEDL